jgi:hypothetical protein
LVHSQGPSRKFYFHKVRKELIVKQIVRLIRHSLQLRRRHSIALAVAATAVLSVAVEAAPAGAALAPLYSASGAVSLSQNGYGSNSGPVTKPVIKPSGATVKAAFLMAAGIPGYTPQTGDITIDEQPVTFTGAPVISNFGTGSVEAEVTSLVKPVLEGAPAGPVNFTINEVNNTYEIDGEILAVVFNDPSQSNNTVTLLYGTQNTHGDTFNVLLANPINLGTSSIQFALGISYGYQPAGQYSLVDVNGQRLTTSAGGYDDGTPENGGLITVGGVGDNPANPVEPEATDLTCVAPPAPRCDDELYTLGSPFVKNGDTEITVFTENPSENDNIMYASFAFQNVAAVVGEGIVLSPPTDAKNVGETHTSTAKIQNTKGEPVAGKTVTFEVTSGPNAGLKGTGVTNGSGQATFSYSSSTTGTDTVVASFVNSEGSTQTSNSTTVTWSASASGCTISDSKASPFTDVTTGGTIYSEDNLASAITPVSASNSAPEHLVVRGNGKFFALTSVTDAKCTDNTAYPTGPGNKFNTLSGDGTGALGTAYNNTKPGYTVHFELSDRGDQPDGSDTGGDTANVTVYDSTGKVVWHVNGVFTTASQEEKG